MVANVEELPALFAKTKQDFPKDFSEHSWYIATVCDEEAFKDRETDNHKSSVLLTATNPANINFLYKFLISQDEFATHEQRRVLSRRLREQFLKQWTVIGIPRVITAVRALATIEAPEDADSSSTSVLHRIRQLKHPTREGTQLTPEIRARGLALCHAIYGEDRFQDIMASWGSMQPDISWLAENVIYGLCLSDESYIDRKETTLMSYACMASMDLLGTSRRHLVGLLNEGASERSCQEAIECVKRVAEWAGKDTTSWITIEDLKAEPKGKEMHDQIQVGKI